MIDGAVAVWLWGEPRSTQGIDIVIHLGIEQIDARSKELEKVDIYLPPDIVFDKLYETRIDLPR